MFRLVRHLKHKQQIASVKLRLSRKKTQSDQVTFVYKWQSSKFSHFDTFAHRILNKSIDEHSIKWKLIPIESLFSHPGDLLILCIQNNSSIIAKQYKYLLAISYLPSWMADIANAFDYVAEKTAQLKTHKICHNIREWLLCLSFIY